MTSAFFVDDFAELGREVLHFLDLADFDDLTLTFPANSLPNIVPSVPNTVVPVLAGGTTPVQVTSPLGYQVR